MPPRRARGQPLHHNIYALDDPSLYLVRPASVVLPEGESWTTATEKARQSDAGVPIAWVPFAS